MSKKAAQYLPRGGQTTFTVGPDPETPRATQSGPRCPSCLSTCGSGENVSSFQTAALPPHLSNLPS